MAGIGQIGHGRPVGSPASSWAGAYTPEVVAPPPPAGCEGAFPRGLRRGPGADRGAGGSGGPGFDNRALDRSRLGSPRLQVLLADNAHSRPGRNRCGGDLLFRAAFRPDFRGIPHSLRPFFVSVKAGTGAGGLAPRGGRMGQAWATVAARTARGSNPGGTRVAKARPRWATRPRRLARFTGGAGLLPTTGPRD